MTTAATFETGMPACGAASSTAPVLETDSSSSFFTRGDAEEDGAPDGPDGLAQVARHNSGMRSLRRRRRDTALSVAGVAVVGLAAAVADRHPDADRQLFAFINHGAGESPVLRVLQQAGTPWVLPATAVVAMLVGRRRLGLAAALALPVEKALEVGIKKARPTPRPLYVEPTVLRDDAPVEGESFPSGHAAIAFATATLVAPHVPATARVAVYGVATGTAIVRVSQGAHHPVDVVAGAALGVAIGSSLRSIDG